jgi:hypothetical protein
MFVDMRDDVIARLVDAGKRRNHKQRSGEQHRKRDTSESSGCDDPYQVTVDNAVIHMRDFIHRARCRTAARGRVV